MGLACLSETELSDLVKSANEAKTSVASTTDIVRQGFAENTNKAGRDKFFEDKEKEVRAIHDKLKAAGSQGQAQEKLIAECEKQEVIDAKEQARILDTEAGSHVFRIAQSEFIRDAAEKLLNARRVDDKNAQGEMISSLREVASQKSDLVKRYDELSKAVSESVGTAGSNLSFEQLKKLADKQAALNDFLSSNPDLIRIVAARSLLQKLNVPLVAKSEATDIILPEQSEIEKIKLAADAELEKVKLRLENGLVARKTDIELKANKPKEEVKLNETPQNDPEQKQEADTKANVKQNKTKGTNEEVTKPKEENSKKLKDQTTPPPPEEKKTTKPKNGYIVIGVLGINFDDVTGGVKLTSVVPDGAASKIGLQAGDVITSFNGKPVNNRLKLLELLGHTAPDQKVEVKYIREGKNFSATATLGSAEMSVGIGITFAQWRYLGMNQTGVNIEKVDAEGPASSILKPGDVIMKVNGNQVTSPTQFKELLADAFTNGGAVRLYIRRKTWLPPGIGGDNEEESIRVNSMLGWEDTQH